jgi:uncharacterized protein
MDASPVAKLTLHQPRDLAGLITLYESNYFRLMRLVPELDRLEGTVVSRVAGALDLYLTVMERFRYTTTLSLTYRFEEADGVVAEPDTRIRVYHDAMVVEVLSQHRRRRYQCADPCFRERMPEVYRKWQTNRFLQKWLGFCQRQGHLFIGCTAIPADPLPLLSRHPRPESC